MNPGPGRPDGGQEPLYPLLSVSRLRMTTDGKGVTTLIAGAGCPLKCAYCINRELLEKKSPTPVTAGELFEMVRIDNLYFQATGGGVAFGGGESLIHSPFIAGFRKLCEGVWRITAETSLNVPAELLETAIGNVDDYIVDVKTLDPVIYKRYTGRDPAYLYANLKTLVSNVPAGNIKVRVPLIPGYNDESDREKTVAALEGMGFEDFDLFGYIVSKQPRG